MRNPLKSASKRAKQFTVACLVLAESIAFAQQMPHAGVPAKSGPEPWSAVERLEAAPWQAAGLIRGLGKVAFPISTQSAEAQRFFDQGIALLHGFDYLEAERSFRQAAALSPQSAMPYWGMALANRKNPARATAFIKQALLLKRNATPREQRWIDAYALLYVGTNKRDTERRQDLVAALESLCLDDVADVEARAFLLLELWDNQNHGMPRPSRIVVEEVAKQALFKEPLHPGVHQYLIRLWNKGDSPVRVAESATALPGAAPGGAHHWHASGLLFAELGRYNDAAHYLHASARVDHAFMQSNRVLPDDLHLYGENGRRLIQNLANAGRVDEAVEMAHALTALPQSRPEGESVAQAGREELLQLLTRFEMWPALIALDASVAFVPQENLRNETIRLRSLGVAAYFGGQLELGKKLTRDLQIVRMKVRARRVEAAELAESDAWKKGRSEEMVAQAMTAAWRASFAEIRMVETALAEVSLAQALQKGDTEEALRKLNEIGDLPPLREAQLRFAVGDWPEALRLASKAVEEAPGSMLPLAVLADLQWRSGERDAAVATFQKLRPHSASYDLKVPVLARLSPVATAANVPADWKLARKAPPKSAGEGDLEKLGPARWTPYAAPAWSLTDGDGVKRTLADFRGRPVLVLFYLGSGCVHCIEQLNTFAPLTKAFEEAGVEIVAVSTESAEDLHKTWKQAKSGKGFPYPLLADPSLGAFRAYGAYDDFEKKPLHGAFLVDGNGGVRWHNIGPEPFSEGEWLLKEAKRLLGPQEARKVTMTAGSKAEGRN